MFSLTVRDHIMIAHSLPDAFFGPAQGVHGATLVVEASWRRRRLGAHAVVLDIGEASRHLAEVLDPLRYANLDEHPSFTGMLSTTEAVAQHIGDALAQRAPAGVAEIGVTVREHPDAWVTYDVAVDA